MIDWVTAVLPCLHEPVDSGRVLSVAPDGSVEWESVKFSRVTGSFESSISVRSQGSDGNGKATHLYVDGNPSKWLQGHNIVGSDDLNGLMIAFYARMLSLLSIPHHLDSYRQVLSGQYELKRVDVNYMFELPTLIDVRSWLHAAEFKAKTRHGRPATAKGTLYFGKNSRRWSIKAYSKYDEVNCGKKAHSVPEEIKKTGLVEWSKNKLRLELTLRALQLTDINLNFAKNWSTETAYTVFKEYMGRIEMSGNTLLTDTQVINLPSALRMTYICWKQGIRVTDMISRATYFRHRKALKEFGIDIAVTVDRVDNSNVVPLIRVLEAKPAAIPSEFNNLIFSNTRVSNF